MEFWTLPSWTSSSGNALMFHCNFKNSKASRTPYDPTFLTAFRPSSTLLGHHPHPLHLRTKDWMKLDFFTFTPCSFRKDGWKQHGRYYESLVMRKIWPWWRVSSNPSKTNSFFSQIVSLWESLGLTFHPNALWSWVLWAISFLLTSSKYSIR